MAVVVACRGNLGRLFFQEATHASNCKIIGNVTRAATCGFKIDISRCCKSGSYDAVSNQWKDVLEYWFAPGAEKKWFHGGSKVDGEIREKFGRLVEDVIKGNIKEWEDQPKPSLALIILADQFTRSVFRNTADAFSGDTRARNVARKFLEGNTHNHLEHSVSERCFIYLPFEHSEDRGDQELSVNLFSKLVEDTKGTHNEEQAKLYLEFATRHKEIINKFGRYPQRNKLLGRENTSEEEEFLKNIPDRYKW